jgi:hypothetical protein
MNKKTAQEDMDENNTLSRPVTVRIGRDYVRFEVLTAVSTKMAVFWVVAPCSLVEIYHRFRGPCCVHHQSVP